MSIENGIFPRKPYSGYKIFKNFTRIDGFQVKRTKCTTGLKCKFSFSSSDFPSVGFFTALDYGNFIMEIDSGANMIGNAIEDIANPVFVPLLYLNNSVFFTL